MPSGIYKRTEEHNKKLSISHLGNIPWNKGKINILSEETKRKIGEARKGIHLSEITKKKISDSHKGIIGIKHIEETKQKISKSLKGRIPWNKGMKNPFSKETLKKMSESQKGEKNKSWKGGICSIERNIKNLFEYRQWRSDIFTRDDFICQECGNRGYRLNAHHIISFSSILQFYKITTLKQALDCEELWNINNGITLCKDCHKEIHIKLRIKQNYRKGVNK